MRYFIDTEFSFSVSRSGDASLDLISIGIVAEDGREYYGISTGGVAKAGKFVREVVLPHLGAGRWLLESEIAEDVRKFVTGVPEFWVYMGAFDYVLLSRMMGGFDCWPQGWPYLAYDLRQLLDFNDRGDIRQPDDAPHNAIEDARWIAKTYEQVELAGLPVRGGGGAVSTIELPRVAGLDEAETALKPVWCSIPSEPGVAFMRCQCGRLTHLKEWDIADDGTVSPSYYHVEPYCDWHVFLRLLDWEAALAAAPDQEEA